MSKQFTSVADALGILGISQRDLAKRLADIDQSTISRHSRTPWSELKREWVVKIFEGVCQELGRGEFTIIGMSGDRVGRVY